MAQQEGARDPHELQAWHTTEAEELLEAHHKLWSHALGYVKSIWRSNAPWTGASLIPSNAAVEPPR
jgi:hypothetical protein